MELAAKLATCYHEAAHAVAAKSFGLNSTLSIGPTPNRQHNEREFIGDCNMPRAHKLNHHQKAVVGWAAQIADCRCNGAQAYKEIGTYAALELSDGDRQYIYEGGLDTDGVAKAFRHALRIVNSNWREIRRLAHKLEHKGAVDY